MNSDSVSSTEKSIISYFLKGLGMWNYNEESRVCETRMFQYVDTAWTQSKKRQDLRNLGRHSD